MMLVYAWDEDSAPDSWRPRIVGRGGSNGRHRTLEPVSALGGRRHSPRGIRPGTHSNLGEISRLVSPGLSQQATHQALLQSIQRAHGMKAFATTEVPGYNELTLGMVCRNFP